MGSPPHQLSHKLTNNLNWFIKLKATCMWSVEAFTSTPTSTYTVVSVYTSASTPATATVSINIIFVMSSNQNDNKYYAVSHLINESKRIKQQIHPPKTQSQLRSYVQWVNRKKQNWLQPLKHNITESLLLFLQSDYEKSPFQSMDLILRLHQKETEAFPS